MISRNLLEYYSKPTYQYEPVAAEKEVEKAYEVAALQLGQHIADNDAMWESACDF